jgi:hypothetical protein
VNDFVFTHAAPTSEEDNREFWLELERSYTLRAALSAASNALDGISQTLLADTIFELQELEFRFNGNPELAVELDEAAARARVLNAELESWLEQAQG